MGSDSLQPDLKNTLVQLQNFTVAFLTLFFAPFKPEKEETQLVA
jgi:hypothetical protein